MKQTLLFFIVCLASSNLSAQSYWQQQSNHKIQVVLNTADHTLDGSETIEYTNNAPDTLTYIWFHIWPNAYKNDRTAFSEQFLEQGRTDFYFSEETDRGYINRLSFSVNDKKATFIPHPKHIDIIKLELPQPLSPHQTIKISTPFHVKLPKYFSRSGYMGSFHEITQWYPKPAVYDRNGWHPMPYLDQGEFYSEFGNYEVSITAPDSFLIAATGKLSEKTKSNSGITWTFKQDNIHDFAFFSGKYYTLDKDTLLIKNKVIDVESYHLNYDKTWLNSIAYIKNAIQTKSQWLGEYPYNTVKVVQMPFVDVSGMEYPTITLISSYGSARELEDIINHEVGHNWFYGILGSNERDFPWMDEGMNSYYDKRYEREAAIERANRNQTEKSKGFLASRKPKNMDDMLLASVIAAKNDIPIASKATDFSKMNYSLIPYLKTARWLELLEAKMGRALFDSMMRAYFETWKFKHPYPNDFRQIAERLFGQPLDSLFALLQIRGSLEPAGRKKLSILPFISFRNSHKKKNIFISPALGYNQYDKLMAGMLVHNYTLPLPGFRYFGALMYSTSSRQPHGLLDINYDVIKKTGKLFRAGFTLADFSMNVYRDSTGKNNFLNVLKLAPRLSYEIKKSLHTSSKIEWTSYFITEKTLSFQKNPISGNFDITYPDKAYLINRLSYGFENNRALYPFSYMLSGEQGDRFMRFNFTYTAYYNYRKEGGLEARCYAGKFFYWQQPSALEKYRAERFHINLSGANGYEDYTYSNYFLGRNAFNGLASQQLAIRDGGFKIRSELLSDKIGKTDDWLIALNLNSTIPTSINPLSVLPLKIPLKVFADIGTYSEAWKQSSSGRFQFDAGLQLSLFKNALNIYAPLFYSKDFRDYVQSTITKNKFWNTLSFSIDLQKISLRELLPAEIR